MSSTEVPIQSKEFITVRTSNKIAIFVVRLQLFQNAEIHVHFLDDTGSCIEVQVLNMEGDDYSSWSTDDQYVINWTLDKLGLSRSTPVVV
jgi:hypothetical protein